MEEKIFKTKTGYCHILPDRIILTRDGVVGNIAKITVGKGIARILIVYSAIAALFIYFAITDFNNGKIAVAIFEMVFVLFLLYAVINSRNNSATPVIYRNKIKNIKFIEGKPGVTRSRFEVFFEDEKGSVKRRLIMLPGSLTGGADATKQALEMMREEKLIS